jgi:thiazole tautomerase (transcriptional regulator TenI)
VVGIGGITPARVAGVIAAGAAGVAVLRGVWEAEDVPAAVAGYLLAIAEARHA